MDKSFFSQKTNLQNYFHNHHWESTRIAIKFLKVLFGSLWFFLVLFLVIFCSFFWFFSSFSVLIVVLQVSSGLQRSDNKSLVITITNL